MVCPPTKEGSSRLAETSLAERLTAVQKTGQFSGSARRRHESYCCFWAWTTHQVIHITCSTPTPFLTAGQRQACSAAAAVWCLLPGVDPLHRPFPPLLPVCVDGAVTSRRHHMFRLLGTVARGSTASGFRNAPRPGIGGKAGGGPATTALFCISALWSVGQTVSFATVRTPPAMSTAVDVSCCPWVTVTSSPYFL